MYLFFYFVSDVLTYSASNHYGNTGCRVFKRGDTKLERVLHKNQQTQRKFLNFQNWCNWEVSKGVKIQLSKSIFQVKNHQNLSQFFFHLGAYFLLLTFFENFNFKSTLFTKIMPIFRSLDLEQMLIYQNFFFKVHIF